MSLKYELSSEPLHISSMEVLITPPPATQRAARADFRRGYSRFQAGLQPILLLPNPRKPLYVPALLPTVRRMDYVHLLDDPDGACPRR